MVSLVRNQKYWGTGPRVEEVNFRYYADANAMVTAMLSSQLDIVSNLTVPQSVGQFSDTSRFKVLEGTSNGEVVLGFNHSNEALSTSRSGRPSTTRLTGKPSWTVPGVVRAR